jgi:hypothetical protein
MTCEGKCDSYSEGKGCWCDKSCGKKGDCCPDFGKFCAATVHPPGSCTSECACGVDELCCNGEWDKTCSQIATSSQCSNKCSQQEASSSSCQGLCGKKNAESKCWCDAKCAEKGDCCADFDAVCASLPVANPACATSSGCDSERFCARAAEKMSAKTCQKFRFDGESCADVTSTPPWQQMRCQPPLVCDYSGGKSQHSTGVCKSPDACAGSPCLDGTTCSEQAQAPGYYCTVDVCDPNPCAGTLECVPAPISCAMSLACPQYKCQTGTPPIDTYL